MARIHVRVTPRAARDELGGFDGAGRLAVRVTAPPADGAANAAVTKLLAGALVLPPRDVVLISGSGGRVKQFEVPLTEAQVASALTPKSP